MKERMLGHLSFWKASISASLKGQDSASLPGYYDLVWCLMENSGQEPHAGQPLLWSDREGRRFLPIFSREELIARATRAHSETEIAKRDWRSGPINYVAKQFMVGDLATRLQLEKHPTPIFLNPVKVSSMEIAGEKLDYLTEEIIVAPIFDPLTKKLMTSPLDEALALLAIRSEDMTRFGIEVVFHMVTNQNAPEEKNARDQYLKQKIAELSFLSPRVPIKKGSGSVLCVMLNLESPMDEMAFIRRYPTLDTWSNVIFVTSNLELLDGELNPIPYDGEQIDTIFGPIIEWQNSRGRSERRTDQHLN